MYNRYREEVRLIEMQYLAHEEEWNEREEEAGDETLKYGRSRGS